MREIPIYVTSVPMIHPIPFGAVPVCCCPRIKWRSVVVGGSGVLNAERIAAKTKVTACVM